MNVVHVRCGVVFLPNPSPSPPTHSAMRDRAWHKVARVTLKPSPSQLVAPQRGHSWTGRGRFAVRHSLEDLHTQFRWIARTIATQLTVHPHAVTMTPLWWKILCSLWTARVQGTLSHLITIIEDRLPRNALGLVVLILGLGVFMIRNRSPAGREVAAQAAKG